MQQLVVMINVPSQCEKTDWEGLLKEMKKVLTPLLSLVNKNQLGKLESRADASCKMMIIFSAHPDLPGWDGKGDIEAKIFNNGVELCRSHGTLEDKRRHMDLVEFIPYLVNFFDTQLRRRLELNINLANAQAKIEEMAASG